MAKTINIGNAKACLGRLVDRAASGEDIVIARAGKPIARLTRVKSPLDHGPRQPGMFPGLTVPDSFFDPLINEGW
jgi:prevent-host-death family protein